MGKVRLDVKSHITPDGRCRGSWEIGQKRHVQVKKCIETRSEALVDAPRKGGVEDKMPFELGRQ